MELGNKILELRKKKGLSQEKLGDLIGVTRQTISNWELGVTSPNPRELKLLSKELNISIDELLDNDIQNVVIEKVSNTEKLSGLILKLIKISFIWVPIAIIVILLFVILFKAIRKNTGKVDLAIKEESIYCTIYGEEHGYSIEYYEKSDIPISMGGDTYFVDILDLGKYEYAHQIFNIINDYVKKNGGTCEMIKDRDLSDIINMYIKDDTLTSTSATIVIEDHNPNKISYGSDFYIEKYHNGKWKSINTTGENYGFNAMAYFVDENGILEMNQNWTHIYGTLPKGIYRLVKNVFFESDISIEEKDKFFVWTEFEIE